MRFTASEDSSEESLDPAQFSTRGTAFHGMEQRHGNNFITSGTPAANPIDRSRSRSRAAENRSASRN